MQFSIQAAAVIGNDVTRSQGFYPLKAGFDFLRATVEEEGRQVCTEPIAGEEIARKQKVKTFAVKTAVTLSMTGKMYGAQSTPVGQFSVGNERLIDLYGPVSKEGPPDRLHETA